MAEYDLSGKTAIVTGASSGIGRATAKALADAGVRVAGGARRVERLDTEIALELDVTDPESCARFVARGRRAAGRHQHPLQQRRPRTRPGPFDESSEEDEAAVFATNVNGLVRMTRLCLPHIHDVRPHRQHGLGRRAAGVREGRELHRLEVRRARLHVRTARRPARPSDPDHDGRRAGWSRRSSRSSASRATPSRRRRSTRASIR